jgi:hypothetical protein
MSAVAAASPPAISQLDTIVASVIVATGNNKISTMRNEKLVSKSVKAVGRAQNPNAYVGRSFRINII